MGSYEKKTRSTVCRPFAISFVNEHVIDVQKQVLFGVLPKGAGGQALCGSFQNRCDFLTDTLCKVSMRRTNPSYLQALGNTIVNAARLTPQGMLVFFASYAQMDTCIERWRSTREMRTKQSSLLEHFTQKSFRNWSRAKR